MALKRSYLSSFRLSRNSVISFTSFHKALIFYSKSWKFCYKTSFSLDSSLLSRWSLSSSIDIVSWAPLIWVVSSKELSPSTSHIFSSSLWSLGNFWNIFLKTCKIVKEWESLKEFNDKLVLKTQGCQNLPLCLVFYFDSSDVMLFIRHKFDYSLSSSSEVESSKSY